MADDRDETARVARAMRARTVWTPTLARLVRGIVVAIAGAVVTGLLALGGVRLHAHFEPCGGRSGRCTDATHYEYCDDPEHPVTMRCARCTDRGGCVVPENPVAGDACDLCPHGRVGGGARPAEGRCTPDKRAIIGCSGCFSVWKLDRTCAPDEVCGPGVMGATCVKR